MLFMISFSAVQRCRSFALTEQGHIGWIPEQSQVGDRVVLLAGGKVPYILRPVESDSTVDLEINTTTMEEAQTIAEYTFIGDAYFHGIVQGERWDEEKLEKFRMV